MFGSAILDVAIGLALVFALVSTICSAIREGLESFLKTRASYLEYALRELLKDKDGKGLIKDFFNHPYISGLYQGDYEVRSGAKPSIWKGGKNLPSYIPGRQFALALFDMAARGLETKEENSNGDSTVLSLVTIRAGITKLGNKWVQRALLCAIDTAGDDLEKALKNVEDWYNGAMDRVSGWYKRSTQAIIFVIALVVVGAMNINAIRVGDYLYSDPVARSKVVEAANNTKADVTYQQARSTLTGLELPIGWEQGWALKPEEEITDCLSWFWNKCFGPALGLMMTAFAATLGAPFWFDIVNKFMVIRSTVKPREKSQEEASEDRQLPKAK